MEVYESQQPNMIIGKDGIMRTARDGDLAVVIPQALKQKFLSYAYGTKLTGHYRKLRKTKQMREKFWWRG